MSEGFTSSFQGPGDLSFSVPQPLVGRDGLNPVVGDIAGQFAETSFNEVKSALGQRGQLDSSGFPAALEGAFRGGFQQAVGVAQRDQAMFNQWSQAQLQLAMAQGPQAPELSTGQRALQGGLQGALVGSAFGGTGAAIGGGIGVLAGLFGGEL